MLKIWFFYRVGAVFPIFYGLNWLSYFLLILFSTFSYLIASMGLQVLWSFGLACLDIYALRRKRDLTNPILVSLFVVGDWVIIRPLSSSFSYFSCGKLSSSLSKKISKDKNMLKHNYIHHLIEHGFNWF